MSQPEGRVSRVRWGLIAAAMASALLALPTGAQATVVSVGSPLTASFTGALHLSPSATVATTALSEPGANVTSPLTGEVVRWRLTGHFSGTFKLRVLHPTGGANYTGAGTSAPQTPSGISTQTFPTDLAIQAGDLIGLDAVNPGSMDHFGFATFPGSSFSYWVPALADGAAPAPPTFTSSDHEFGFNADVATVPSNSFGLGALARNKKKGTATLAVNVPGPGALSLNGNGLKTQRAQGGATASTAVTAPGTVKLLIRTKGKAKKKLKKTGKAKVKVNVTYTPSEASIGGLVGGPNTQNKSVKLVKK